ncbi:Rne/Rng family ribonuclease [Micromonospora sp. WMMD714]|uniref:Rne/Rng family ribonuclease n=1 Tax=Micromonospora sp. WMMD714 TaxID=3016097 RepID=UPI00249CB957|nr:Rne/Rng family ribonuclease [Micromonospora sp. WMMD714]WFE61887.1 Rne/Rng family ribonuclease [Micromonospora sp. WMMD714]
MLENEPEGGERTGSQPAADTADTTIDGGPGAGGAPPAATSPGEGAAAPAEEAPAAPTRRRTTRRRVAPLSQPELTGAPAEASDSAASATDESQQAEVIVPVAGELDAAPKTTRRRRKATPAKAVEEPVVADGVEEGAADLVAPVKATRTRRKKAAPPAATEPPVEVPTASLPPAEVPTGRVTGSRRATGRVSTAEVPVAPGPSAAAEEPAVEAAAPTEPTVVDQAVDDQVDDQAVEEPVEEADQPTGEVPPGVAVPAADEPVEPAEPQPRTRRRRAAIAAPTVLFMAPQPEELPTFRVVEPGPVAEEPVEEPVETGRRRRRARREAEPVEVVEVVEEEPTGEAEEGVDDESEDEDDESAAARRRRRRGRRGRGRGKGGADDTDEDETEEPAAAEAEGDDSEDEGEGEGDGLTRRRRRRRRRGAGDAEGSADDGVPTVVKIREPRKAVDEVQGVSGSTRLEAKRQRRRDGREQRRTRPPILSESEFLARREAVDRVMAVRQRGDRTQIAVLEDGVLVEHYVTRNSSGTMAGNVYLGKVQNVLPSMEAAFVDVGRGRNAVLYAGEVNWDTSGLEGRSRSIEQALRSGDSVLVQVTKDPIGHKGARLTSHVALSGRHLVYVPNGNASGISRKLPDTERKRLRDVLKKLVPDGAGVIVRTAAEGASEDELARDVKRLQAQWEDIQAKATAGGAPVLLYEEPDLVIRVVRDLFNEDFRELVIEGEQSYGMVESYLSHVSPDLVDRVRRYVGTADVFTEYRIDEQIIKGLDRKVFLPSGGSLVIDRTEAMTVIDVNTGKYTGSGGNLEETVTRNNLEAAEEIVRQLRLRDIGGIVVIDFIDMVLESNRELVLRRLTECLGRDRTKHQVTEITSLGLVQMTRKRIGAGLLEAFSEPCECCKGRGLVIHTEPVPEKPRAATGAGERVKAVASTVTTPAAEPVASASSRRRARKAATAERAAVETTDPTDVAVTAPAADAGYDDTMGYDLSRYETPASPAPAVADVPAGESARLAGADDPDAVGEHDGDDDGGEGGTGRRRSRRGGARRRTRP